MQTQATTQAVSSNYINLHCTGIGYLGRVRTVKVRKGEDFIAASIRAMSGEKGVKDGIQFTPFDVKAVSEQAAAVLKEFMALANSPDYRVTVQFRLGDFVLHSFTHEKGPKAGETGTVLKGRLLLIQRVWVKDLTVEGADSEQAGNQLRYEYQPPVAQEPASEEAPAVPAAQAA